MAALKHVGRIKNTGRRCVVVFREIYNTEGHVVDENNCLVFETESLPDAEHQDLMRIVESDQAQTTGDLFDVLGRSRLGTGEQALNWLASSNRLRKYPSNNVDLTPDSSTVIGLDTLNKIVKMQKAGASQADIENVLRDDTDSSPRDATNAVDSMTEVSDAVEAPSGDVVMDDAALAVSYIDQAKMFEAQAKDLRVQAKALKPAAKKRAPTAKKPAKQ
jgi:hypothetical protein|tara:strand:+ start:4196 stop:4849 length:654 start_codon:yes stop_codon:yes gene_type:complete